MYFFGRFSLPVHPLIDLIDFKSIEAETETSSYLCPGGPQACSRGRQWKGESSSWRAFHCRLSFFCDGTKNKVVLKLSKIFRENMSPAVIFFMVSEQKWLQGVIMAIWSKILRKPSRSFSNTHPRGTC